MILDNSELVENNIKNSQEMNMSNLGYSNIFDVISDEDTELMKRKSDVLLEIRELVGGDKWCIEHLVETLTISEYQAALMLKGDHSDFSEVDLNLFCKTIGR